MQWLLRIQQLCWDLWIKGRSMLHVLHVVLLFGSMSIKEHRLHMDSPDIDFSLVELKKNPKTCSNPVIINQFSFLLHCQYQFKSFLKLSTFWAIR